MKADSVQVTIVAASAETLDGLQGYLSRAGMGARGTRQLAGADADPCSAVIFFPDDFSPKDVHRELRRLRRERPKVVPLVVTGEPNRYAEMSEIEGKGPAPIVLPKPAWGWTILEAIREAMEPRRGE
jgi:hypothetical protein